MISHFLVDHTHPLGYLYPRCRTFRPPPAAIFQPPFTKSLADLLGSITGGRERFTRELRQLRAFRFAALVIEARWPDVLLGTYKGVPSAVNPNAVIGSLMAFAIKYGVIPILADDHQTAAQLTERLLLNFARMIEKDFKALDKASEAAPAAVEA